MINLNTNDSSTIRWTRASVALNWTRRITNLHSDRPGHKWQNHGYYISTTHSYTDGSDHHWHSPTWWLHDKNIDDTVRDKNNIGTVIHNDGAGQHRWHSNGSDRHWHTDVYQMEWQSHTQQQPDRMNCCKYTHSVDLLIHKYTHTTDLLIHKYTHTL